MIELPETEEEEEEREEEGERKEQWSKEERVVEEESREALKERDVGFEEPARNVREAEGTRGLMLPLVDKEDNVNAMVVAAISFFSALWCVSFFVIQYLHTFYLYPQIRNDSEKVWEISIW